MLTYNAYHNKVEYLPEHIPEPELFQFIDWSQAAEDVCPPCDDNQTLKEEKDIVIDYLATPLAAWGFALIHESAAIGPQEHYCVDPRLTIGERDGRLEEPPSAFEEATSGTTSDTDDDKATHWHNPSDETTKDSLHRTTSPSEGATPSEYIATDVEEEQSESPKASGSKPVKAAGRKQRSRTGIIRVGKDDRKEPTLPKDALGYANPEAALARLADRGQRRMKVECFDRVFFPEEEKHKKCPTRGHVCNVRMMILHDPEDELSQPTWVPISTPCRAQQTAESYRRHLLGCHLANPRPETKKNRMERSKKAMRMPPSTPKELKKRQREDDDDDDERPVTEIRKSKRLRAA